MFQTFEFGGNVVSLYSTVDGQLAFGEMIEKLTNRHCKTAIFSNIPDEMKGVSDRKTTTPHQDTIKLMCNAPFFLGNTDERLHILRLLAGTLQMFIHGKIPASNDPIKIREPNADNLAYRARLISRDGAFTLVDFEETMYPELCEKFERENKRQKQDDRLIIAITPEQVNAIMTTYVDSNVIANRPFRCSLES